MKMIYGAWAVLTFGGFAGLTLYGSKEGKASGIQSANPRERAELLVFIHPKCPCSRATITELKAVLREASANALVVRIFAYEPVGDAKDFIDSRALRRGARLPNTRVEPDPGGRIAESFGVATSGQVLYVLEDGVVAFSGGITGSRGHEGDNPGRRRLLQSIRNTARSHTSSSPVFGCPIF